MALSSILDSLEEQDSLTQIYLHHIDLLRFMIHSLNIAVVRNSVFRSPQNHCKGDHRNWISR